MEKDDVVAGQENYLQASIAESSQLKRIGNNPNHALSIYTGL
jgi:hypothetical protein